MKLVSLIKAIDGHICGGTEYMWKAYPNSRYLDICDIDNNEIGSCVFCTDDQEIYEVTLSPDSNRAYRWMSPVFKEAHYQECAARNILPDRAWDDVSYQDLEEQEMLDLAHKVVHGTYVHSKPIAPPEVEPEVMPAPSESWPFDGSQDDEMYSDAAEIFRRSALEEQFGVPADKEHYLVTTTLKLVFDVKAESMDNAAKVAIETAGQIRLRDYSDDVCFVDQYVSKTSVEKEHE